MRGGLILTGFCALLGTSAAALDLAIPGNATLNAQAVSNPDSYDLPVGPYADGNLPVENVEGHVRKQSWRIAQASITTLQVIRALETQLAAAGYVPVLSCGGQACGGFDFRFNTDVMAAPDMYVDLFDFRFLSARGTGGDAVSVFVSKVAGVGYVQIIHATPDGGGAKLTVGSNPTNTAETGGETASVIEVLTGQGHVILKDLDFATGSAALGEGPHASLRVLAEYLLADQNRRIALVGHTDLVGSLADNVKLSKERAGSVLSRLVEEYGVPRRQLDAEGIGYLSPLAPNDTRAGRETNRRVEAVLLRAK